MLKASYEFENGYMRPIYRGIVLWNGNEDEIGPDNPERVVGYDLVYELIGAEDTYGLTAYDLKGIKVTIEIEEVTRQ